MRILLIHNPSAGGGKPSGKKLRSAFEQADHEIQYLSSKEDDWKKALKNPEADVVVAAGGDGLVRRLAVGLATNGHTVPLAILPLGTANNVACAVGADADVDRMASGLSSARQTHLSIGLLQVRNEPVCRFVEAAGVGFFSEMLRKAAKLGVETMDDGLKLLRRIVIKATPLSLHIEADGVDLSGSYLLAEAMNIPSIGARLLLAPAADLTDDRFDLVLVTESERRAMVDYLDRRLQGEELVGPVRARRARKIRVTWKTGCGHVDDQPWPAKRDDEIDEVTIEVDRHLQLLIP